MDPKAQREVQQDKKIIIITSGKKDGMSYYVLVNVLIALCHWQMF